MFKIYTQLLSTAMAVSLLHSTQQADKQNALATTAVNTNTAAGCYSGTGGGFGGGYGSGGYGSGGYGCGGSCGGGCGGSCGGCSGSCGGCTPKCDGSYSGNSYGGSQGSGSGYGGGICRGCSRLNDRIITVKDYSKSAVAECKSDLIDYIDWKSEEIIAEIDGLWAAVGTLSSNVDTLADNVECFRDEYDNHYHEGTSDTD